MFVNRESAGLDYRQTCACKNSCEHCLDYEYLHFEETDGPNDSK